MCPMKANAMLIETPFDTMLQYYARRCYIMYGTFLSQTVIAFPRTHPFFSSDDSS